MVALCSHVFFTLVHAPRPTPGSSLARAIHEDTRGREAVRPAYQALSRQPARVAVCASRAAGHTPHESHTRRTPNLGTGRHSLEATTVITDIGIDFRAFVPPQVPSPAPIRRTDRIFGRVLVPTSQWYRVERDERDRGRARHLRGCGAPHTRTGERVHQARGGRKRRLRTHRHGASRFPNRGLSASYGERGAPAPPIPQLVSSTCKFLSGTEHVSCVCTRCALRVPRQSAGAAARARGIRAPRRSGEDAMWLHIPTGCQVPPTQVGSRLQKGDHRQPLEVALRTIHWSDEHARLSVVRFSSDNATNVTTQPGWHAFCAEVYVQNQWRVFGFNGVDIASAIVQTTVCLSSLGFAARSKRMARQGSGESCPAYVRFLYAYTFVTGYAGLVGIIRSFHAILRLIEALPTYRCRPL